MDFEISRETNGLCSRCHRPKPGQRVFLLTPKQDFFAPPAFDPAKLPRSIEMSCADCLTDEEVAWYLAPVAFFVLEELSKSARGDALHDLRTAAAYLQIRAPFRMPGTARKTAREMIEK